MSHLAQRELLRELAEKNGVVMDASDPVLVLQTAMLKIVDQAIEAAFRAQQRALAEHESRLEAAAARSVANLEELSARFSRTMIASTTRAVDDAIVTAAERVLDDQRRALALHRRALSRASWVCGLTAACAVLTSAAIVVTH